MLPTRKLLLVAVVLVAIGVSDISGASTRDKDGSKKKITNGHKTRSDPVVVAVAANETLAVLESSDKDGKTNATTVVVLTESKAESESESEKDQDKKNPGSGSESEVIAVAVETETGDEDGPESEKDVAVILDGDKLEEVEASNGLDTAKPKPNSYMTRVKNLLKRVLDLLGLTRQRKNRLLSFNQDNSLDSTRADYYTEEVRATVGALLGKRDCFRRAVCGAGSYLRHIKGKEVIIILLEKIIPASWTDSVNYIKEAAIYKDKCDYKCMDD